MKKVVSIPLGAIIITLFLVIIFIIIANSGKRDGLLKKGTEDFYRITYSASYNNYNILMGKQIYEIVTDEARLNEIMQAVKSNDSKKIFDSKFFENKKLLIIEGGINSEVNAFNVNDKDVNIQIYCDAPLTSMDQIWNFDLYIVPIDNTINTNDIKVQVMAYPDRIY